MIESFKTKLTSDIFHGDDTKRARKFDSSLHASAARKLDLIHAAAKLDDLKSPPGNMLEALKGDLEGFHSIRINQQWRIIFRWESGIASDVAIIDYH